MHVEKTADSPVKLPFVAHFTEPRVEFPSADYPYSDQDQMGMWDPTEGKIQPMLMSPTQLMTSGGDSCGDEAH